MNIFCISKCFLSFLNNTFFRNWLWEDYCCPVNEFPPRSGSQNCELSR